MNSELAKTPLYDWHVAHGGRMVEFGGWWMPVQYSSIVAEHQATRRHVGLFDISHMGRLWFEGPAADEVLDRLVTRRVRGLPTGAIRYGLITNEQGGILDDVLVYRLQERDGRDFHLLVVNASNRPKIKSWIDQHVGSRGDVTITDRTTSTAMIAVQGPQAMALVQPLVAAEIGSLKYYTGAVTTVAGRTGIVSRTGYTGEDGCELIVPADAAAAIWESLLAAGAAGGALAAGLGARDTLRLEAAMPLYGHELTEAIDPYQAGLAFAVQLKDREFIGSEALRVRSQSAPAAVRVGLSLEGRRVPREHCPVLAEGRVIGEVTSGTFSPTLDRPIAMAYLRPETGNIGAIVAIDIRGRTEPATIVELPFYRRTA